MFVFVPINMDRILITNYFCFLIGVLLLLSSQFFGQNRVIVFQKNIFLIVAYLFDTFKIGFEIRIRNVN